MLLPRARFTVRAMTAAVAGLRSLVAVAAAAALIGGCLLLPDRGPLARHFMLKQAMALRVLLFGLAAILAAVWCYLKGLGSSRAERKA